MNPVVSRLLARQEAAKNSLKTGWLVRIIDGFCLCGGLAVMSPYFDHVSFFAPQQSSNKADNEARNNADQQDPENSGDWDLILQTSWSIVSFNQQDTDDSEEQACHNCGYSDWINHNAIPEDRANEEGDPESPEIVKLVAGCEDSREKGNGDNGQSDSSTDATRCGVSLLVNKEGR